jgi:23S rRNA pseudouridine1911/1915/1917 synthase
VPVPFFNTLVAGSDRKFYLIHTREAFRPSVFRCGLENDLTESPFVQAGPLEILYEDNHLLAVLKPAGISTMGVAAGEASALTLAKQYIKRRYAKPGNVYLGVVSRLDAPVSGVLLLARTSKAAARLSAQFRSRGVEKIYWAIVDGPTKMADSVVVANSLPPTGDWTDLVYKDEPSRRMRRIRINRQTPSDVDSQKPRAQEARLTYRLLGRLPTAWHVEIVLETGRKHQIRVQFGDRGWPILGDRRYGSQRPFPSGIALHARQLAFDHPISWQRIVLSAPIPRAWRQFGIHEGT